LYLRLHRGPMNTLSNYTQRQDSIGIGIRFASF
jgi:outer membrane phospholipase A